MDFEVGIDRIGLAGELSFGQLSIEQEGNDAVIRTDSETLALLNGIGLRDSSTLSTPENFSIY